MSFSSTPLGQGRRLSHHTFLNKPHPDNRPHSPPPTSYSYGAPILGSRSPPKPTQNTTDEPALVRYQRLKKEREQAPPLKPAKWNVNDTTVNIANAFHQAATASVTTTTTTTSTIIPTEMQSTHNTPNNSWASGSRPNPNVPRSTSVEYEKETQSTGSRRLAAPPSRLAPRQTARAKPLSKSSSSMRPVPDSEAEEDPLAREKSPFEQVVDAGKDIAKRASYYLKQRTAQENGNGHVEEDSYGYENEEREFQAAQKRGHARGRISVDNKAYKPSNSDVEEDDDDFEDDDKKGRRRRKKKPEAGGRMALPVMNYDKRKKKRGGKGGKGNQGEADEDESDEQSEQHSITQPQRASAKPPSVRRSVPPEPQFDTSGPTDESFDVEQGLDSIPEIDEHVAHHTHTPGRAFSVGGALGSVVHGFFRLVVMLFAVVSKTIGLITFLIGSVLGVAVDVLFSRPARWLSHANPGPVVQLLKYALVAFTIWGAWYVLREPMLQWIPHRSGPAYTAPEVPAANIAELSARLQTIENALSGLSLDHQTSRSRQDKDSKVQSEIAGRLGVLESRVQKESARAVEAEEQFKAAASKGLQAVKQEIETLQAQVEAQRSSPGEVKTDGSDEEARVRLKALEERVGSVEGGVKEALDLGKQSVKAGGVATSGAAWWNKLASGSGKSITIKSSDGQDVTSLIGHLVDTAVSKYSKDNIARPDFAAYSSGGQIIPSLSSPTYEMRPHGLRRQLVGLVTGHGYAVGRPPVTALNHETHNGHCWPFPGTQGQLGVVLTAPAYIEDITIDHVAKEVALDMRSAPREMEVWAMIDGADNIRKVKEWRADKARRRQEAEEEGLQFDGEDEPEYPRTLPKSPQYLRIANFTYDIHAPQNIQTFPVSPEIRALGVDFGIVVLRVMSNWGRDEFTCLYRFRVHGQMMGEIPLPYPESAATA